ncbi:hypothetical protein [Microbacterium sp. RU33B]|uniref:hypothetical protein n=1 Tax=Microbacterium sp. RU33B TaxID=1907390 RepID=UPI00095D45C0|nr:hypothetical protein [Microbacterium sp. RU33B]SIT86970.1 hypothetical protein SAMN05880545_2711 [Microbacterium sp. RU33B]
MNHIAKIATVALMALALAGCTATVAQTEETATSPAPTAQAVGTDGCKLVTTDKEGRLSSPILDGGERAGASGPAILDADGNITGYQVVTGDAISAIADRFCMEPKKIFYRNGWRPTEYPTIPIGAMLLAPSF